ncbi:DUF5063 domain-containing protein [Metabacillus sp. 84]|uniref:DUF5063 domain-containing protein n=1 Tax=unclassified Metabacillus TaxID=2675274 RepID=UPI003CEEA0AA
MKDHAFEFFHSASRFCRTAEQYGSNQEEERAKMKDLLSVLIDLYAKALSLPETEIAEHANKEGELDYEIPSIDFQLGGEYWEVFDPYERDEPVQVALSDDILDIYKDVKSGIFLYEKGFHQAALWNWKFMFEIHWGMHASDAIRAMHWAIHR